MRTAALLAALLLWAGAASAAPPKATLVKVDKAGRTLQVFAGQTLLATYPIVLGRNPVGHKTREGDKRTPEGRYVLDYKNPRSAYHLSIHVSYPNAADRAQARAQGVPPGGDIMIPGQPNNAAFRRYLELRPPYDWTDGCIALSNADMKALWDQVQVPVPIQIDP